MGCVFSIAGKQGPDVRPGNREHRAIGRRAGFGVTDVVVVPVDGNELVAGKDDLRAMAVLPVTGPGPVPARLLLSRSHRWGGGAENPDYREARAKRAKRPAAGPS